MTDINKNITDAYKSMYKTDEEVLDETNKNDKSDDGEGLDAVQPKAVKKKFNDRKDKDIDNDGDVDSSDEYLHKRRKAVSKAVKTEEVDYPHMMYSKDGKEVEVKDEAEHEKYTKKGYSHKKPEVAEGTHKKKMKDEDTVINVADDDESPDAGEGEKDDKKKKKKVVVPDADEPTTDDEAKDKPKVGIEKEVDKKKKSSGNSGEKKAEISKIGEQVSDFTNLLNELMGVDAVGKKKKEKDGSEPDDRSENSPEGETDFIDAHGKKDTVADGEKDAETSADNQKKNKQGKHVTQQKAKGDAKPIKSTEAPVKGEKEVKDGEGKKSIKTENTLMDLALKAMAGKSIPEMAKIVASTQRKEDKSPFDARTKDAKSFLERMHKRMSGKKSTSVKDNDPKDLPMIKGEK